MVEYIDITPTWEEILPTWLHIARQAYRDEMGPYKAKLSERRKVSAESAARFEAEMLSMARAADKWNAHCKEQGK